MVFFEITLELHIALDWRSLWLTEDSVSSSWLCVDNWFHFSDRTLLTSYSVKWDEVKKDFKTYSENEYLYFNVTMITERIFGYMAAMSFQAIYILYNRSIYSRYKWSRITSYVKDRYRRGHGWASKGQDQDFVTLDRNYSSVDFDSVASVRIIPKNYKQDTFI